MPRGGREGDADHAGEHPAQNGLRETGNLRQGVPIPGHAPRSLAGPPGVRRRRCTGFGGNWNREPGAGSSPSDPDRLSFTPQARPENATMSETRLFGPWIRATWAGWALGVPLVILLALAGESLRIGPLQFPVGLGMGMGVGFMQGRVVRNLLGAAAPWRWSCALGLALPFLVADLAQQAGRALPYSLYLAVALGGLIVGIWQALLLRRRFSRVGWWVAASVLGWSLAAGLGAVADGLPRSHAIRGIWGALAYLGIVAGGGLVLGVVTGLVLSWMPSGPRAASTPEGREETRLVQ